MTSCPITCAVCAYKESPYIEECIKSLLQQTVRPVIFISTSTPNAFITNLAKKYELPLHVNTGKGMQNDFNWAFQIANTPYVTICHQDDIYEPTYVEELLKPIKKDTKNKIILLHTRWKILKDGHKQENRCSYVHWALNSVTKFFPSCRWLRFRMLALGNAIKTPNICYNKSNCPNPLFVSHIQDAIDWENTLRLAQLPGKFIYISKPVFLYRVSREALSFTSIHSQQRAREDLYIFSSLWPRPVAWLIAQIYKLAYHVYD